MEDVLQRATFGTSGFLASVGLQDINAIVSLLVGIATLCYMGLSIIKILKNDS